MDIPCVYHKYSPESNLLRGFVVAAEREGDNSNGLKRGISVEQFPCTWNLTGCVANLGSFQLAASHRYRANLKRISQSRPDSGLGLSHFSTKVYEIIKVIASPLVSGMRWSTSGSSADERNGNTPGRGRQKSIVPARQQFSKVNRAPRSAFKNDLNPPPVWRVWW